MERNTGRLNIAGGGLSKHGKTIERSHAAEAHSGAAVCTGRHEPAETIGRS